MKIFDFIKKQKDTRTKKEKILDEMKRLERELAFIYEEEIEKKSKIIEQEEEVKKHNKMEAIFEIQADYAPDEARRMLKSIEKDEEAQKYAAENVFNMKNSITAKKKGLTDDWF